jgi:hypothetical protein
VFDEPGCDRVAFNIRHGPSKLFFRAHETVEILAPPQRALSRLDPINGVRRDRLPGLQDVCEWVATDLFDNDVDVCWHDTPRRQCVAFAVTVQKAALHLGGVICSSEQTAAVIVIQLAIRPLSALNWIYDAGGDRPWHGVRQAEDEVLNQAAFVTMREIPA